MEATKVRKSTANMYAEIKKKSGKTGRLADWKNNPNRITVVINDMKAVLK